MTPALTAAKSLLVRQAIFSAQLQDLLRKSQELEHALTKHIHDLEDEDLERRRTPAA
jgi:hypothetical protein